MAVCLSISCASCGSSKHDQRTIQTEQACGCRSLLLCVDAQCKAQLDCSSHKLVPAAQMTEQQQVTCLQEAAIADVGACALDGLDEASLFETGLRRPAHTHSTDLQLTAQLGFTSLQRMNSSPAGGGRS